MTKQTDNQTKEFISESPAFFDAYAPAQIARRIEKVGLVKTSLQTIPLLTLSILAGAFIAFGAMFYTVVITNSGLGFGITRFIGGLSFCLGLILVVVGGAELFTGNVLIVMGWANKTIKTSALLRNWTLSYMGNLIGAVGLALLGYWAGFIHFDSSNVGMTIIKIANAKVDLPFETAFVRGILCNALVCLAIWLCFAAHSVTDKILAILFPITAFVALGFEHSIANMYFIPAGILTAGDPAFSNLGSPNLNVAGLAGNLIPVTLGNIVGGGIFVALSYYLVYLHKKP